MIENKIVDEVPKEPYASFVEQTIPEQTPGRCRVPDPRLNLSRRISFKKLIFKDSDSEGFSMIFKVFSITGGLLWWLAHFRVFYSKMYLKYVFLTDCRPAHPLPASFEWSDTP